MAASAPNRTLKNSQAIGIILDLAALIRPIVAIDAQCTAFERQSKAERLDRTVRHLLPNQMMDEERGEPVLVRIVASDHSLAINVLKVAFNAYAADIKSEVEQPLTETNLLKLLTD